MELHVSKSEPSCFLFRTGAYMSKKTQNGKFHGYHNENVNSVMVTCKNRFLPIYVVPSDYTQKIYVDIYGSYI